MARRIATPGVWLGKWQALLGQPLVLKERGRGARLAPLGETLLWAERRLRARLTPQLESFSAEMHRELAGVVFAAHPAVSICASHDLALAGLRDLLAQRPGVQLDLEFRGSLDSLEAFGRNRCDLAGFHVAEYHGRGTLSHLAFRRWLKPRAHRLVDFVTRQQGLVVASTNPKRIRTLGDLAQPGVRFVNRQRGSGTRFQFDQLLWEAGIDKSSIEGYQNEEFTHLAVAATIGSGQADAGYGIKAAAAKYGGLHPARERTLFLRLPERVARRADRAAVAGRAQGRRVPFARGEPSRLRRFARG